MLLTPEGARAKKVDAFEVTTRESDLAVSRRAPLEFQRGTGASVEKLTIELVPNEADPKKGSLHIAWGTFSLTSPIEVEVELAP